MYFSPEVNVVNEGGKEHEHPRAISKEENKKENVKIRTVYKKLIQLVKEKYQKILEAPEGEY